MINLHSLCLPFFTLYFSHYVLEDKSLTANYVSRAQSSR